MKKLLIALILPLLVSCELTYDAETRMVFETTLLDSDGNPLENIEVAVEARNSTDTEVISKGRTGIDGKILLIFPMPDGTMDVLINDYYGQAPNEFQRKKLRNLHEDDFVNYKYSYTPLVLFRPSEITNLNLSYENVSFQYSSVRDVYISGDDPAYEIDFNPDYEYDLMPYQLQVIKNSNILLHYTLVGVDGSETPVNAPLSIGEESINYTITY
ncbi:MAG: hypothetical protein ITG00_02775 [Flavobacterium sp.]|nr:hypothetical protein [Flavobacterium sp.]